MAFSGFVTYLDLYVALRKHEDLRDHEYLFGILKSNSRLNLSDSDQKDLQKWCRSFCYRVHSKWRNSKNCSEKFMKKNSSWLDSDIIWPQFIKENIPVPGTSAEPFNPISHLESIESLSRQEDTLKVDACTSTSKINRKIFEDLSDRQKRRRISEGIRVRTNSEATELAFSAVAALQSTGNREVAEVLKHMLENPEAVSNIKKFVDGQLHNSITEVPAIKALALYVTTKLSKWRYNTLREFSMREGISKYPSYYKLQNEKKKCYPEKNDIIVTETAAKIRLQALLDLTTKRLLESLYDTITDEHQQLVLVSKWGFDGASDQSEYKQKTSHEGSTASVFMASLVPLKLTKEDGEVVWQNERSSSTFYCRPIMFKFMKETEFNVLTEMNDMEAEISELHPTISGNTSVKHQMLLTMIDGKISSYISGTASSVCDICRARPSEMNDLNSVLDKPVCDDMYKYGISSLHAWIRCMECLLHIAYRLDFKTWAARGDENKKLMESKKHEIQQAFRKETGLLLDIVKQSSGTTNDGNSARRFFRDPEKTASLTGLDVNLVRRFAVILQCISSGEKIKIEEFRKYCIGTAELYVELYPWYYMPSSVHKLLIHGPKIIEFLSVVPIGLLSEEVSESRNKDFRRYRENNSRKINRIACNEDVLNYLLISSDPVLAKIRPRMESTKKRIMMKETRDLIVQHETEVEFADISDLLDSDSDEDTLSETE